MLNPSRLPINGRLCIGNGDIIFCCSIKSSWKQTAALPIELKESDFGDNLFADLDEVVFNNSGILWPKLSWHCKKE